MEPRGAHVDVLSLDGLLGQHFLQGFENSGFARGFLRPGSAQRPEAVLPQAQAAGFVDFKLGELQAARPEINGEK